MIDCSLHTITHLIWKNANFIVRKIKIQKQNLYFFPVFFLDSNHYIIPVCVLNVPINERTEWIFSHFFHRIFGQFTWLNGILVLRKTMIITENYMSEFGRRRKKNTSSIWCFIQIIDSHRTIKYNETSASHSCAEKTSRNKSQESERMKDRTTPSDFS